MPAPIIRRGHAALRRGRVNERGRSYLLTCTTVGRLRLFDDFAIACAVARQFTHDRCLAPSRLWCWVLMPDHWHGIVELGEHDSLAAAMRRIKSATARAANLQRGSTDAVWQRSFHDRALRSDAGLVAMARYVISNPRRAGLVTHVGDYPFWDAVWV